MRKKENMKKKEGKNPSLLRVMELFRMELE